MMDSLAHLLSKLPFCQEDLLLFFVIIIVSFVCFRRFHDIRTYLLSFSCKDNRKKLHSIIQKIFHQLTFILIFLTLSQLSICQQNLTTDILRTISLCLIPRLITLILNFFYLLALPLPTLKRMIYAIRPMAQFFSLVIVTLFLISVWSDIHLSRILAGLAATTAVILFIFKDSITAILTFINLTISKTMDVNDWIEIPEDHIDGVITEITFLYITVENWNNTTSHIPIGSLSSKTICSWENVFEKNRRRIRHQLSILSSSLSLLDPDYKKELLSPPDLNADFLPSYTDISLQHHQSPTNLDAFRSYALCFIKNHPAICPESTLLIRIVPTLPHFTTNLEIYCFSKITQWAPFEAIKTEIIAHLYGVLPLFHLKALDISPHTPLHSPHSI